MTHVLFLLVGLKHHSLAKNVYFSAFLSSLEKTKVKVIDICLLDSKNPAKPISVPLNLKELMNWCACLHILQRIKVWVTLDIFLWISQHLFRLCIPNISRRASQTEMRCWSQGMKWLLLRNNKDFSCGVHQKAPKGKPCGERCIEVYSQSWGQGTKIRPTFSKLDRLFASKSLQERVRAFWKKKYQQNVWVSEAKIKDRISKNWEVLQTSVILSLNRINHKDSVTIKENISALMSAQGDNRALAVMTPLLKVLAFVSFKGHGGLGRTGSAGANIDSWGLQGANTSYKVNGTWPALLNARDV